MAALTVSAPPVATSFMTPTPLSFPPAQTMMDTGLPISFIQELALKIIYFAGEIQALAVADQMCLPHTNIVENALNFLVKEEFCQITGATGYSERAYKYVVTGKGERESPRAAGTQFVRRSRARTAFDVSRCDAAPGHRQHLRLARYRFAARLTIL